MNMALRLIHAAAHGENQPERLWWLKRPSWSFKKRTGTSAIRRFMRTDFKTISAADVRESIYVRPPKPAPRSLEDTGAPRQRNRGGRIGRTVDDDDLAEDIGAPKALLAPVNEKSDREGFVEGWDDNGKLGIGNV